MFPALPSPSTVLPPVLPTASHHRAWAGSLTLSSAGRGLLPESAAVAGNPGQTPRRLGLGELGAVHHLLHHGHAAAGLRPAVPEGAGAGTFCRLSGHFCLVELFTDAERLPREQFLDVPNFLTCSYRLVSFLFASPKNKQIEKEVSEAMMKSLKYCDVDSASARQPLCQYRAATIHHRLASMYHSCLRNQVSPPRSPPARSP